MILHIYVADKFIPPFIRFMNLNFEKQDHIHFVINKKNRFKFEASTNLINVSKLNLFNFIKLNSEFQKAEKVILHGLFWNKVIFLLALNFTSLKKCFWAIWGGDLYKYQERTQKFSNRLMHPLRKFCISRIGNFITYLPADYELAKKWYNANGRYHECLLYLSNVFNSSSISIETESKAKIQNVLLGNSASKRNRHSEAFKLLLPFKGKVRLWTPLTYGDLKYGNEIIKEGHVLFGTDFIPLTTHLPLDEYYKLLNKIDFVVFNHDRQQGMGNLIQLLGLGKKVFIDFSTSQKTLFDKLGITVFDVKKLDFEELSDEIKTRNQTLITEYFSEEKLKNQWQSIFESNL